MSDLANTLPELRDAHARLASLAAARGIRFNIADFGGFRTQADTTRILEYRDADYAAYVKALKARSPSATPVSKAKFRPIAAYGHSFHDYGAAFDVFVTTWPGSVGNRSDALAIVGQLAPAAGLRWGHSFGDDAHFELPIALEDARQRWTAYLNAHPAGASSLGALLVALAIGAGILFAARHATGLQTWR